MNTQVKTKYLKSTYTGAPQIDGTFGSLVKVLKYVLVEGFNELSIVKGTYNRDKEQIELFFENPHGFAVASVVSVSGSTDTKLNKEFRVVETDLRSIILHSSEDVDLSDVSSVRVKFAPLGYKLAYDDITSTGTACFESTDGYILKMIDAPLSGYNTNWTKYARVVAGENIDSEGNFINNQKFPKHPVYPDLEKTGNGSVRSGKIGYLSWEYTRPKVDHTSYYPYTYDVGTFESDWQIIGDDRTFYLFIDSMGQTINSRNIYTFGIINKDNAYILNGSDISEINGDQYATHYYGAAGRNGFTNMKDNIGCFINKTKDGRKVDRLNFSLYHITLNSSNTTNQALNQGNNPGNLYTPITVVDTNKDIRGNLRGIYQLYDNSLTSGVFLENHRKLVIRVRCHGFDSADRMHVPYLFSLEDW